MYVIFLGSRCYFFIVILFIVFLLFLKIVSDLLLFLFLVIIEEGKSKMILNGYFKVMVNV